MLTPLTYVCFLNSPLLFGFKASLWIQFLNDRLQLITNCLQTLLPRLNMHQATHQQDDKQSWKPSVVQVVPKLSHPSLFFFVLFIFSYLATNPNNTQYDVLSKLFHTVFQLLNCFALLLLQTDRNANLSHVSSRNETYILNYFLTLICEHEQ